MHVLKSTIIAIWLRLYNMTAIKQFFLCLYCLVSFSQALNITFRLLLAEPILKVNPKQLIFNKLTDLLYKLINWFPHDVKTSSLYWVRERIKSVVLSTLVWILDRFLSINFGNSSGQVIGTVSINNIKLVMVRFVAKEVFFCR